MFERRLYAGWGDMDFNSHMRNTAFLDKSADVRVMYFREHGFPASEFARLGVGPVIMRDEVEYFREVGLLDELAVDLTLAGLAEDGSRFCVRNEFRLAEGQLAARLSSTGGWLDLARRKLVAAPAGVLAALQRLPRTDDYRTLPSSIAR